jgi:nucleoside-diphosphate-sugar epimerase
MKILITGGTGFLGRHLTWRLAALGHDVVFTGRNNDMAKEVILHSQAIVKYISLHHGEEGSQQQLIEIAKAMDAVVHCAALSSPWGKAAQFDKANVVSTREVLLACKLANIKRLVHISTPSIYFNYRDQLDICENEDLPPPVNLYAASKAKAELLVKEAMIPETVILRPRALFGPWDNTLMPRLLRVMNRGAIPLIRGGKAMLDITYIDNAVEAIVLSLTKPLQKPLSIFNVTNAEPQYLDHLLRQLAAEFKLPLRTCHVPWCLVKTAASLMEKWAQISGSNEPPITCYSAGVLAFSQTLDISAIRQELGYEPAISIEEGLRRHAQWYFIQQQCNVR